jgi:hypothetical protein
MVAKELMEEEHSPGKILPKWIDLQHMQQDMWQKILSLQGVAKQALVQLAYAIGVAEPVGFYINTYGTSLVKDSKEDLMDDGAIARILKPLFRFKTIFHRIKIWLEGSYLC